MNYVEEYISIINNALKENRNKKNGNYECHHILPKSLFPELKNDKLNHVLLTPYEHFLCHKLLVQIFPSKQMNFALYCFTHRNNINISEEELSKLRNDFIDFIKGENNPFYGKTHSNETKKKMSEFAKKRALNETKEQKDRRRCNHTGNRKGVKLTDEEKKVISERTKEGMKKIDTSICGVWRGKKRLDFSEKMKGRKAWNKGIYTIPYDNIKEIILKSGVDLTKFGWSKKLSDLTGISINQITKTVRHFEELNQIAFSDRRRKK